MPIAGRVSKADAPRSRKAGGAIPPRVFRLRVLVAVHHRRRFEPCDNRGPESHPRRAGSGRCESEAAFPAAASAARERHACQRRHPSSRTRRVSIRDTAHPL